MPFYASSGIYVDEVSGGTRPIAAVATSTAGFVGTAPDPAARPYQAVAVGSWSEFTRVFASGSSEESTPLARAVYGFFDNGGGRCYVVNVVPGEPLTGRRRRLGLDVLESIDEVAIVAAPGYADPMSHEALLSHCERLGDRVAILDPPAEFADVDRFARAEETSMLRPRRSDHGAMYLPWLVARDPLTGAVVPTPPSGHVAGVWARTDYLHGVHRAPANEQIRGAVDLTYRLTRAQQEMLNPLGVNCIRSLPTDGVRILEARTLAVGGNGWGRLHVRRLFNMLRQSIVDGTRWAGTEPHDDVLRRAVRHDVGAFLTRLWRDGALPGRAPEEAFFVTCDEETNPSEVRDAGRVVALIGVALVEPTEFVVFRLTQSMGGADTEVVGA